MSDRIGSLSERVDTIALRPSERVRELNVAALIADVMQGGVTSEELSQARALVVQLEREAPDPEAISTRIMSVFSDGPQIAATKLSLARTVLGAVEAQAANDARVAPLCSRDVRASFQAMLAHGHFAAPPPSAPTVWSDASQKALAAMANGEASWRTTSDDARLAISVDFRVAGDEWTRAGRGAPFLSDLRAFAAGVSAQFPPGTPGRAEALAQAYQCVAERFFVHIGDIGPGQDVDYSRLSSGWSALFTEQHDDGRFVVDCEGFVALAREFFTASGAPFHSLGTDNFGREGIKHAVAAADIDGQSVGISNSKTGLLPTYGAPDFSTRMLAFVRASGVPGQYTHVYER